jgi:4'-phosphopantetheinyl transferase
VTPAHPRLRPGELHLWWFPVPPGAPPTGAGAVLDAAESVRAARLREPGRRHRYVFAHAGLRLLCARYLGTAPGGVVFERAACPRCGAGHGRPRLRDGRGLEFSLSHSGAGVLYAFAGVPVGVDLESAPARAGLEISIPRLLHPTERRALAAVPEEGRAAAFLRLWVRKEAYLKGAGTGVAHGVDGPPGADDDAWALLDVDVPAGFVAAAAVRGDAPRALRSGTLPPADVARLR